MHISMLAFALLSLIPTKWPTDSVTQGIYVAVAVLALIVFIAIVFFIRSFLKRRKFNKENNGSDIVSIRG